MPSRGLKGSLSYQPDRKWHIILWATGTIFLLISILGFFQTGIFNSLFTPPTIQEIRQEIVAAQERQRTISQGYRTRYGQEPETGIVIGESFGKFTEAIKREVSDLQHQGEINDYLRDKFGVSLDKADVVILPSWVLYKPEYNPDELKEIGLTEQGWENAKVHAGEPNVPGYTIRDRFSNEKQLTLSGKPRIFLNEDAFLQSQQGLRLTIFHELLHGINIPGHPLPAWRNRGQTDLDYLPAYHWCISHARLRDDHEFPIWTFVIIFFVLGVGVFLVPPKDPPISLNLADRRPDHSYAQDNEEN
jgi:hypothetical protein